MTLKYSNLTEFVKELRKDGFITEISDGELRLRIAKTFDIVSDYAIGTIIKAMHRFGFVEETSFGVWKMKGFDDEQAEEKAADDILKKATQ